MCRYFNYGLSVIKYNGFSQECNIRSDKKLKSLNVLLVLILKFEKLSYNFMKQVLIFH